MEQKDILRTIREIRNLSQTDVAEQLGMRSQAYRHYEIGDRNPKTSQLNNIAEALGCSSFLLDPTNCSYITTQSLGAQFAIVEWLCDLGIVDLTSGHIRFADWLEESREEIETLVQQYEEAPAEDRERLLLEMALDDGGANNADRLEECREEVEALHREYEESPTEDRERFMLELVVGNNKDG